MNPPPHSPGSNANPLVGFVVFNVPRGAEEQNTIKPFDISLSSLDCLVEMCPDGRVRRNAWSRMSTHPCPARKRLLSHLLSRILESEIRIRAAV